MTKFDFFIFRVNLFAVNQLKKKDQIYARARILPHPIRGQFANNTNTIVWRLADVLATVTTSGTIKPRSLGKNSLNTSIDITPRQAESKQCAFLKR